MAQTWRHYKKMARSMGYIQAAQVMLRDRISPGADRGRVRRHRLPGTDATVRLRDGTSDFAVFQQIFRKREYDGSRHTQHRALQGKYESLAQQGGRPLIIDCGANVGLASIWFARRFPAAQIWALEPEPDNFELLRQNTAPFPNIVCLQAAAAGSTGRASLFNATGRADSWRIQPDPHGGIELLTISDVMARAGVDRCLILKVDIEGAERELFGSRGTWIGATDLVIVEPHDWMLPWEGSAQTVLEAICARGRWDFLLRGELLFCYAHTLRPFVSGPGPATGSG